MSMCKYPGSLPRKMYWSDDVGGHAACPDCGASLESEHHAYIMVTRQGGAMDFHLTGNTAGHFCEKCPVVVLDRERFEDFAALVARSTDGPGFLVMGIVDLDAVPEDRRSMPFDDDRNPVPLVQFTNIGAQKRSAEALTKQLNSRRRKSWKERR